MKLVTSALVLLLGAAALPASAQSKTTASPSSADAYVGFDLDLLAECSARRGDFKTRFGEKRGEIEFEKFLEGRDLSRGRYDRAYAAWWERFQADPTKKLFASYHTKDAAWTNKLMFGDVPDMSQTQKEGVTLDQYVRVNVGLTKPGAKLADVLRAAGIRDANQWNRASKAWGLAMSQDTSFRLTSQYGELWKKHSGAGYESEQEQKLAGLLAEGSKRPPSGDVQETKPDLSPEALAARLESKSREERWSAARWLGLKCDEHMVNKKDKAMLARCAAAIPVLEDILDHHDDDTVSRAEDAARQLADMIGGRTFETEITMQRCLNRARSRLETLNLTFAPLRDKAVPERLVLRTKIEGYGSLVKSLDRELKAWKR